MGWLRYNIATDVSQAASAQEAVAGKNGGYVTQIVQSSKLDPICYIGHDLSLSFPWGDCLLVSFFLNQ